MRSDQRGFSAVVLLITLLVVTSLPVYFLLSKGKDSASQVMGASTTVSQMRPGFSVSISSLAQTWDLVEYLCETKEECLDSLTSGRRFNTVSGGQTELHDVVVNYSKEWDNYSYIKYFVRSGLYKQGTEFKIVNLGDVPGSSVHEVYDGTYKYSIVLLPIKSIQTSFYTSAVFSDN